MRVGRVVGLTLTVLGPLITAIGFFVPVLFGSSPRIIFIGPIATGVGVALCIFPGGKVTLKEAMANDKPANAYIKEAPVIHKVFRVIGGVVGAAIVFMSICPFS